MSVSEVIEGVDAAHQLIELEDRLSRRVMLRQSTQFANQRRTRRSTGAGSVDELNPRDAKACEELAALVLMAFADGSDIKITEKAMK